MKTFLFSVMAFLSGWSLPAAVIDPWVSNAYQKRILLTNFSPMDPTSPLNDFPVLVAITNAAWLDVIKSDGGDITFAGIDGKQFFHDVEFFGVDGGGKATLQAWVCVPTLSNNTAFYLYWKNTDANLSFDGSNTTRSLTASYTSLNTNLVRTNTWDTNYLVVLHLNENTGLPKDASAFRCDVTMAGTNIFSNKSGIGVGMGNSMQGFNNTGWGGYFSTNMLYTAQMGAGYQGMYGLRIYAFTNAFGGNAAADRLYNTNANGGGNLTHSMWVRFDDYPSNFYNNVFYAGNNNRYTNYAPSTNANTCSCLWGVRRGYSEPDSDGYGSAWIYQTNGVIGHYYRGWGVTAPSYPVVNTNLGPVGYYRNWFKFDQTVNIWASGSTTNVSMRFLRNGATLASNLNSPFTQNESGPRFQGLTLAGTTYEYLPATYTSQKGSPRMYFDEYRLSAIARSSNWSATEYSSVVAATNSSLYNGADGASALVVSNLYADITNVSTLMVSPLTIRGYHVSPLGIATAILVVNTAGGTEAYRAPVIADSARDWHASPSLSLGSYSAYLIVTNAAGQGVTTATYAFTLVAATTLTVRSITPSGVLLAGERLGGPGLYGSGVRTNNSAGEASWANLYSGVTYGLTNFAPITFGLPFLTTNITMPATDLTVIWILPVPENLGLATNSNASSRADAVAYFPSLAPYLSLSVPSASNATLRVIVSATPISGGRKVQLFDGSVGPAFPFIQVASSDLKLKLTSGTWVLEFQYLKPGLDRSKTQTSRRMLFFAQ
ncbi:MAG: hypothetical protein J0L75_05045 [Spirochaetes bacterium]|nr:hypothetical protein [Spirochaetota bacterium]